MGDVALERRESSRSTRRAKLSRCARGALLLRSLLHEDMGNDAAAISDTEWTRDIVTEQKMKDVFNREIERLRKKP